MILKVEIFLALTMSVPGDMVHETEPYTTVSECLKTAFILNTMYADSENKFLASCVLIPRADAEKDGA